VSTALARHRKPQRSSPDRPDTGSRHRKASPRVSKRRSKRILVVAAVVAGSALVVFVSPVVSHWTARTPSLAWVGQADALGLQAAAGLLGVQASQQTEIVSVGVAIAPVYLNPLRNVTDLVPERIDQGVDFAGSGPVYALGDGVVTNATGDSAGWPGGGWITYQLTDGPDQGLTVYVAEDVTPTVQVGQQVTPSTVVGDMFEGYDGIETGWAQPGGVSAESQLPQAGAIGGEGPFPTEVGLNFEELLQTLGVPTAPNRDQTAYGLLPPNYPTWG
jgi:hypothetical protein